MQIEIKPEDGVVLPHIGPVRGVVGYAPGYPSTYWEPAESPEVERADLIDSYGRPLVWDAMPDEVWDAAWCALEEAVSEIYGAMYDEAMMRGLGDA